MGELNMVKAQEVYESLCSALEAIDWNFDKKAEQLTIVSSASGDDFPVEFVMRVNPRNEIVTFTSWLPFKVPEDKRVDLAIAICVANYRFADGSFDYNVSDGTISFRLTASYKESTLGAELFRYMLGVSISTVDDYNDKFFMLIKNMMTVQQFIENESK